MERPSRVVSGGQSGVDRAALDVALAFGIPCGGWCPLGRWAEDGPIPPTYPLCETPEREPLQRTEWNVRDADATLILSLHAQLTGGTATAAHFAVVFQKSLLHVSREKSGIRAASLIKDFFRFHAGRTINIAGPRESQEPGVGAFARFVLEQALRAS